MCPVALSGKLKIRRSWVPTSPHNYLQVSSQVYELVLPLAGSSSVGCRSQTSSATGKRPHCDHCCQRRAPVRGSVLTRPARPGGGVRSRTHLPSTEDSHHRPPEHSASTGHHHHHHHNKAHNMDPQAEPLLSEANSCSTLLTECGAVNERPGPSAFMQPEVMCP